MDSRVRKIEPDRRVEDYGTNGTNRAWQMGTDWLRVREPERPIDVYARWMLRLEAAE